MIGYTDDQILDAIGKAIRDKDMPAAADLLQLLAAQAPAKAQLIVDTIHSGLHPVERLLDQIAGDPQ